LTRDGGVAIVWFARSFATADAREELSARLEKRAPTSK
jgi:hypothetical protein